jgi:hypothetical protein
MRPPPQGWLSEFAAWAIVAFLGWGGTMFLRSARRIRREKRYVHPTGRTFEGAEIRWVVIVQTFVGLLALAGAGLAAALMVLY